MEKKILKLLKTICPDFVSCNYLKKYNLHKNLLYSGINIYYKIAKNREKMITTKKYIKISMKSGEK